MVASSWGCELRHHRVARLVFSEAYEAAAAGDLKGSAGGVDRVGDVHGRSLADSLRRQSARPEQLETLNRMAATQVSPALKAWAERALELGLGWFSGGNLTP